MSEIEKILKKVGICYQNRYDQQFEVYFSFLVSENEKYNLTAVTEKKAVYEKHFADSLYGAEFFGEGDTILDVGSGAGFPSVPIAIVRNDLIFTLLDATKKKVDFLNALAQKLGLDNIRAVQSRIEDYPQKAAFDAVTSRAVAPMPTLCEYLLPFVKIGGKAVIYKGANFAEELKEAENAIKILGGTVGKINEFALSDGSTRAIIEIKKTRPSPDRYPRKGNKPKSNPL